MNITQKQEDKAQKIIKELDLKELFINESGEFFTTENLAKLSVSGDSKKFQKIEKKAVKSGKEGGAETVEFTEETAKEKLLSTEVKTLDYTKEMKPLVELFKLDTADNKKASLIEALEKFKETLKAE
jgi:hypothetical protein